MSVHRDCHVQFERVLYSTPFTMAGKTLWLRATDATVALFEDYRYVAIRPRGQRAGQLVIVCSRFSHSFAVTNVGQVVSLAFGRGTSAATDLA